MLTRRDYLRNSALLSAACALPGGLLQAFESSNLITRAIPKTGEKLPIIGLGSSATFRQVARRGGGRADTDRVRAQLANSFEYIGKDPVDLIQVHNLADLPGG